MSASAALQRRADAVQDAGPRATIGAPHGGVKGQSLGEAPMITKSAGMGTERKSSFADTVVAGIRLSIALAAIGFLILAVEKFGPLLYALLGR